MRLIALLGRTFVGRGLFDVFRDPELPERMVPAGTYPWAEPDDPSAVKLSPANGFLDVLVVGDVIVMTERVTEVSIRRPSAVGVRVRAVDREGNLLFTGPALAAESGVSDGPHLRLLGDGRRVRVAFSYHKTGPSGRLAYVDIYDPAARGHVRPQTVRLPTDEQLEWAAGHTRRLRLYDLRTGKVIARSNDPLPQGGTTACADYTRQHEDLLMTWQIAASTRHRWVHGGWNIGYYAIWQGDLYGFPSPENPFNKNPMALWIPPTGTPAKFPVTGHAAPLGVTTDGHAIALTGTFRDRALYVLPPRR
jgi:hypothetical protein